MNEPLSETESKLFSNAIFDQTGLVIGAKSIKNYSVYVHSPGHKEENPSVATLDTLARYVLDAPLTDETQRKNRESHYPYWFQFKNKFYQATKPASARKYRGVAIISSIALLFIVALAFILRREARPVSFTDTFHSTADDSLIRRGWFVKSKADEYWQKRNQQGGFLTLFTLKGDNWPDSVNKPAISNLLLRKIPAECFSAEVHFNDFFPQQNWQQAGMVLLEDTNFTGKSLRFSLSYNDFYGGFPRSREIILQAIESAGQNSDKPEEIAHQLLFRLDSDNLDLVRRNLQHTALRIEKQGKTFRLLFANGSMTNSAFKEIVSKDIDLHPHFIGLFALRGFVDSTAAIPAKIDFFNYLPTACEK